MKLKLIQKLHRRIVLDCTGLIVGEQRGRERFMCSIIRELAGHPDNNFAVLTNKSSEVYFRELFGPERCVTVPISGNSRSARVLFQIFLAPVISRLANCRLWIATNLFPAFGFQCQTAAFVHDLMIFQHPESFGIVDRIARQWLIKASVPSFTSIFTVSEFSRSDIVRHFQKRGVRRVFIVPNGAELSLGQPLEAQQELEVLRSLGLKSRQFFLSVLGGKPYKNQLGLKGAAENLLRQGHGDVPVVVVGDAIEVFQRVGHPPNLLPVGVVPDEILGVLYRNARAFVFPTFFEGFGIPVIEAQSIGIPVTCSDLDILREVSGGAALFFDPRSPELIARSMVTLLTDDLLRERLVQEGKANAARYTWHAAAAQLVEACSLLLSVPSKTNPRHTGQAASSTRA
jgi:glycosyltransferase involved in cell wall biosynthesis